jgi:hypothetical protein
MRQPVSGTTQVYADAAEYLKGLGMTKQEELTRVLDLAMNPASLYAVRSRKRGLYNPAVSEPRPPAGWVHSPAAGRGGRAALHSLSVARAAAPATGSGSQAPPHWPAARPPMPPAGAAAVCGRRHTAGGRVPPRGRLLPGADSQGE